MRAVELQAFGQPLVAVDRDDPVPAAGEELVRVTACGVCHSDLHVADGLFGSPLQSAVVQGLLQAIAAVLLFVVGRQFGGHGSFAQSVALTAWSGVPMVALQAVQLLALAIAPPLAAVAGMVAVVVNFWLITLFACELHGFRRPWLVLAAILGLSVLLAMAFIMVISIFFGVPPDV